MFSAIRLLIGSWNTLEKCFMSLSAIKDIVERRQILVIVARDNIVFPSMTRLGVRATKYANITSKPPT